MGTTATDEIVRLINVPRVVTLYQYDNPWVRYSITISWSAEIFQYLYWSKFVIYEPIQGWTLLNSGIITSEIHICNICELVARLKTIVKLILLVQLDIHISPKVVCNDVRNLPNALLDGSNLTLQPIHVVVINKSEALPFQWPVICHIKGFRTSLQRGFLTVISMFNITIW